MNEQNNKEKITRIEKVIFGPSGEPQKGLQMKTHDIEKVVKLQTKLMWIILTAIIVAGATNFMDRITFN